jgi:ribosomal protein L23
MKNEFWMDAFEKYFNCKFVEVQSDKITKQKQKRTSNDKKDKGKQASQNKKDVEDGKR